MKLTIFGATGRTGRPLVEQALAAGHDVRVLVRNRAKLGELEARAEVVEGDLMDRAAIERALEGAEAVIMAAGPVKGSPVEMLETAARAIVDLMREHGQRRLVWLTGAGVRDERDEKAFSRTLIRGIMKVVAGKVLASSERAYGIVTHSGLDYTVVRPPMLADEPGGIGLEGSYTPPKPIPVGRGDLAGFLLNAAVGGTWVNESPFVSYTERISR